MTSIRSALLIALGLVSIVFTAFWILALRRDEDFRWPKRVELLIGFVTDFFDTLGIGSFAITTSAFRLFKVMPDENIPGALNVGHSIPTFLEALIFIAIVEIKGKTLALMILASVLGAWLGAGVVCRLSRRKIQIGMGAALLCACVFFIMKNMGLFPDGGNTLGLTGARLIVGCAVNFMLGALMTLGIGAYAPCMILTSLLGMNPKAAFPIMMGSCAFLMPTASIKFIQKKRYGPGPSLGLTLGGAPAVLIAAYLVKELPLTMLRWLVVVVVLYTSAIMLRSALAQAPEKAAEPVSA